MAELDRRELLTVLGAAALADDRVAIRHHGALIRVPSLDSAFAFYGDGMGFPLAQFDPHWRWARLVANLPIYLEQSEGRLPSQAGSAAEITFQVNDLATAIPNLQAAGAHVLTPEPYTTAVGRSIRFADSAGVVHHMMQAASAQPPFAEPRIYNCGFHVSHSAIGDARVLFSALGFLVMSERYYPPSLPYLERDHSFAFMLHEHQPFEADLEPRLDGRANDLGVWIVFTAPDLENASEVALHNGAIALTPQAEVFGWGRRRAFSGPAGAPFEIWSWT